MPYFLLAFWTGNEKINFSGFAKNRHGYKKRQVRSKYKNFQGYQCQWKNPNECCKSILSVINFIKNNKSWEIPEYPISIIEFKSNRAKIRFAEEELKKGLLRNFLAENKVLSYVITNRYLINYIIDIDL